jgi:hypothetical protein
MGEVWWDRGPEFECVEAVEFAPVEEDGGGAFGLLRGTMEGGADIGPDWLGSHCDGR